MKLLMTACHVNERERVQPQPQIMTDLPKETVSSFSPIYIDYFSSITVTQLHSYTCLTFCAIHLEPCEDFSAQFYYAILKIFVEESLS